MSMHPQLFGGKDGCKKHMQSVHIIRDPYHPHVHALVFFQQSVFNQIHYFLHIQKLSFISVTMHMESTNDLYAQLLHIR
jgi:hypothetical protein